MKKKILFFLKILVSVVLISYLVTLIDKQELLDTFKNVKVEYVIVALFLLVTQVALSSLKWKFILRADDVKLPYGFLLKTYLIGNFISLFLPSSIGGDVYRIIALKGQDQGLAKSTSSVLFDRMTGLFALLSISLISYLFLPDSSYKGYLLLVYILGIMGFIVITQDRVIHYATSVNNKLVSKASRLLVSFKTYRKSIKTLVVTLFISFIFQFTIVVINKLYCMALGIDIPFLYLLVIIPLVYLTEVLPISINGIGVRDSAFVFFFTVLGYSSAEGFALALLVITMRYVAGLVGGSVLLYALMTNNLIKTSKTKLTSLCF